MKKFALILVILFCIKITIANAVPIEIEWEKTIGSSRYDGASKIIQAIDEGFVICGWIDGDWNPWKSESNYSILKLDKHGIIKWEKSIGEQGGYGGTSDYANCMIQTNDGDLIICGYSETIFSWESNSEYHSSTQDREGVCRVLKISSTGKIIWNKRYGMSDVRQHATGNSIIQANNNEYLILDDISIFKINSKGHLIWQKLIPGKNRGKNKSYPKSITKTIEGGYALCGKVEGWGGYSSSFWTIKIDDDCKIEWEKTYGGDGYEGANEIIQTIDGGYVVCGYTSSKGAGGKDVWIVKLNKLGEIEWDKTFGDCGYDLANSIIQTYDGGFAICGKKEDGYIEEIQSFIIEKRWNSKTDNFWIIKLDRSGTLEWDKMFDSGYNDQANSIVQTNDGGFAICGYRDYDRDEKDSNIWIVKLENPDFISKKENLLIQKKEEMRNLANFFLKKGEFETNDEYNERISKGKKEKQEIENKYELKIGKAREEFKEMQKVEIARKEQEIKQKIRQSLAEASFQIHYLGTYNAESETFPITINNKTEYIKIPRAEAKDFKENWQNAEIRGMKQLRKDLETYEYFNLVIVHPTTGNMYKFGEQRKDIVGLEELSTQIVSTKSVIPPSLSLRASLSETNNNNFLDAEEKGRILVEVSNTGEGTAFGVIVDLKNKTNDPNVYYSKSRVAGEIQPGKTKTLEFEVEAKVTVERTFQTFIISAEESNGFNPETIKLTFETYPLLLPEISMIDYGVSTASGDSRIIPGETANIKLRFQNIGKGDANDIIFKMNLPLNVYFAPESKQEFSFTKISSGKYKDLDFSILTSNKVGNQVEITVSMTEKYTNKKFPFTLEIDKQLQTIQEFVEKGKEQEIKPIQIASELTVDIAKNIPITSVKNHDAIAVVIGNRDYLKTKNVNFAINDVSLIKEYLIKTLGYKDGNIFFIKNASKGEFELYFGTKDNYFGKLYNTVKENKSDIFVYYSGHGGPGSKDEKAYFIPIECDPNYVELGGYSLDTFYRNLSKIPAKSITVILDACFSGVDIIESVSPIIPKVDNPIITLEKGIVFTSSKNEEYSCWYNEKNHGMFTYFFLKAIHDKNADNNNDNNLTVSEIYNFISDNTEGIPYFARRIHGREQHPMIFGQDKERVFIEYK